MVEEFQPGVFGIERTFEISAEPWCVYKLLDGGKIRLKTAAMKIYQLTDREGKPQLTPKGEPLYSVQHKTDVVHSM